MRELASTFRIKIQFIEFLCENSPPSLREGRIFWALRLKVADLWALSRLVPSVPAKGPGTSAEDSKYASRIWKLAIASFQILAHKDI